MATSRGPARGPGAEQLLGQLQHARVVATRAARGWPGSPAAGTAWRCRGRSRTIAAQLCHAVDRLPRQLRESPFEPGQVLRGRNHSAVIARCALWSGSSMWMSVRSISPWPPADAVACRWTSGPGRRVVELLVGAARPRRRRRAWSAPGTAGSPGAPPGGSDRLGAEVRTPRGSALVGVGRRVDEDEAGVVDLRRVRRGHRASCRLCKASVRLLAEVSAGPSDLIEPL